MPGYTIEIHYDEGGPAGSEGFHAYLLEDPYVNAFAFSFDGAFFACVEVAGNRGYPIEPRNYRKVSRLEP